MNEDVLKISLEFRKLMELHEEQYKKLEWELNEAKEMFPDEVESIEALKRQCRTSITMLFRTMKSAGLLDKEEEDFGALKVVFP